MRMIYTTGGTRRMEFAVVSGQHALPLGAEVLAVCDGERTVRRLDEQTFESMTDEEYYTLHALLADAQRHEVERAARHDDNNRTERTGTLRRFLRRTLGL